MGLPAVISGATRLKYFFKLYYETDLVGLYQVQSTGISNYQFEAFLNYQTVLLPALDLQAKVDAMVEPIPELKDDIALQTVVLRQTRDALLPRLISGKLSVDALDIRFPPGMLESGTIITMVFIAACARSTRASGLFHPKSRPCLSPRAPHLHAEGRHRQSSR